MCEPFHTFNAEKDILFDESVLLKVPMENGFMHVVVLHTPLRPSTKLPLGLKVLTVFIRTISLVCSQRLIKKELNPHSIH